MSTTTPDGTLRGSIHNSGGMVYGIPNLSDGIGFVCTQSGFGLDNDLTVLSPSEALNIAGWLLAQCLPPTKWAQVRAVVGGPDWQHIAQQWAARADSADVEPVRDLEQEIRSSQDSQDPQ